MGYLTYQAQINLRDLWCNQLKSFSIFDIVSAGIEMVGCEMVSVICQFRLSIQVLTMRRAESGDAARRIRGAETRRRRATFAVPRRIAMRGQPTFYYFWFLPD